MRLIDADALKAKVPNTNVDIFEDCRNCSTLMDWQVKELIDKMPTIDSVDVKHGEWIPCSERLPNGQTEVIVSCCDDAGDYKYNYTSFGWMTRDGEYWIVDNEINYYVNAWMPLPEPWRGAER